MAFQERPRSFCPPLTNAQTVIPVTTAIQTAVRQAPTAERRPPIRSWNTQPAEAWTPAVAGVTEGGCCCPAHQAFALSTITSQPTMPLVRRCPMRPYRLRRYPNAASGMQNGSRTGTGQTPAPDTGPKPGSKNAPTPTRQMRSPMLALPTDGDGSPLDGSPLIAPPAALASFAKYCGLNGTHPC